MKRLASGKIESGRRGHSLGNPKAPIPAHWSKDFVEHLRTVHFALIAISAGLIVLVLGSHKYDAARALVQIEEIIDLKCQWSKDWIVRYGRQQRYVREGAEVREGTPPGVSYGMEDGPHFVGYPLWGDAIVGQFEWKSKLELEPMKLLKPDIKPKQLARLNEPVIMECQLPTKNWLNSSPDWSPETFPRTLNEFRNWWNLMYTPQILEMPEGVAERADDDHRFTFLVFGDAKTYEQVQSKNKIKGKVPMDLAGGLADPRYLVRYGTVPVTVRVQTAAQYLISQETVASVFRNIPKGGFEYSFADLSSATKNDSELPLQDIKEFLHDEASKGGEMFEALGMKFPADKVTVWGIVLVISVQLYFALYLRQLSGKLRADDPGWDTPWVGMDTSKVGQTILFVTVVLLPVSALFLLDCQVLRGPHGSPILDGSDVWIRRSVYSACILALPFACLLAILSWIHRPRVRPSDPVEPSPLFY